MRLTKEQRSLIIAKSNGRCWYCGCELSSMWDADHFKPVGRYGRGKMTHPELDIIDNLVPSCKPCNNYKWDMDIETLRTAIKQQVIYAKTKNILFKNALKFGLIQLAGTDVVFYFEKEKLGLLTKEGSNE